MITTVDVVETAGCVDVPTLVLHRTGDRSMEIAKGREMARLIRGSTFIELAGNNHLILEDDEDSDEFFDEVRAFLAEHRDG